MTSSHGEMDAESVEKELSDPKNQLPAVMARNEETVREGFWKKMARVAGDWSLSVRHVWIYRWTSRRRCHWRRSRWSSRRCPRRRLRKVLS